MPGRPKGGGRSEGTTKAPTAAKPHRGGWGKSAGPLPRSDRVPPPPVPFVSLRPHARRYVVTAHHHTRVALPRHKPAPPALFPFVPIAPALRPDRVPPRPHLPLLPSLRYTHRPAPRYFHSTPSLPSDARRVPAAPSEPFATPPCPSHPAPSAAHRPAARRPFRLLPPRIRPASTPFLPLSRRLSGAAEPLFSPTTFGYPDFFVYL